MTQRELAEKAGISAGYLGHIESGKKKEVGATKLRNLSRALEVSVEYLLKEMESGDGPARLTVDSSDTVYDSDRRVPLYLERGAAVSALPIEELLEGEIDLHTMLVPKRDRTIVVRVAAEGMAGAGIHAGDLVVVQTDHPPANGNIVVARIDGSLTVRRYVHERDVTLLLNDGGDFSPILLGAGERPEFVGVVRFCIHVTG